MYASAFGIAVEIPAMELRGPWRGATNMSSGDSGTPHNLVVFQIGLGRIAWQQ
jgi:hypothetical protein